MPLPTILVPHPHVHADEHVLGGSPYVATSRVPVRRIYAFWQQRASVETIMKRFPQLTPAQVFDAIAFALDNEAVMEADLAREQDILARAGHGARSGRGPSEQITLPFEGASPVRVGRRAGARAGRRGAR